MTQPDACEWCGHERSPRKKATCSPAHRAARWRWLNDVHTAAGAPEPPPWAGSPLHGRRGEESRANTSQVGMGATPGPRSGVNARSGVMLSYRKTRESLLSHFPGGERLIDEALTEALAPTQRRKMEVRDAR